MNEYMMEAKRLADTNLTDNEGGPLVQLLLKMVL